MTLQTNFKLPIETVEHQVLNDTILKDLEVIESKTESEKSKNEGDDRIADGQKNKNRNGGLTLYDVVYHSSHPVNDLIKNRLMATYTTDVSFLTQTQTLVSMMTDDSELAKKLVPYESITSAYDVSREILDEDDFHSKYQYIEIGMLKGLNHSPHFMQMLSFYNMLSPVITLLTPIVIMILPFFLIRFQGVPLSIKAYIGTIKHLLRNHAIGKMADSFGSVSWDKRIYLLITVTFYILQVYQNALSCYRFTRNMIHIHKQLFILRDYLRQSCNAISATSDVIKNLNLTTYESFASSNGRCLLTLRELLSEMDCITPLRITIPKACQVGNVMRLYYSLRHDDTIRNALTYSFEFNVYTHSILHIGNRSKIQDNTQDNRQPTIKSLNPATFVTSGKWTTKNMKYPLHSESSVGNTFSLSKPIILTGPNASGKTTLLKSAFLNTLLSQQVGYGFYDKLVFTPYDGFHCYLDIPDTSGRDSLFQAEARRCLDVVSSTKNAEKRFFCIFDELYSGTNPTEAVAGAYALTKHLSRQKNTTFVITTHFYELCKLCEKNKLRIMNCQMGWMSSKNENEIMNGNGNPDNKDDNVVFTYKMKTGVSRLQGGVRVLKQIGYPSEIVTDALNIIKCSNTKERVSTHVKRIQT